MKERHIQEKVGAFVLLGLVVIAILIISFGRLGQLFQTSYDLIAEFPNASGIIKNSQVLYRGAKVGIVGAHPHITKRGQAVDLVLRINSDVLIPKGADFRIGIYGLLGDRYVDIIPPANPPEKMEYMKHGDRVLGSENKSFGDMLANAEKKLDQFDKMIRDLQSKLFTEDFIDNFHASMRNARGTLEKANNFMGEAEKGKGPLYTLMKDQETAMNLKQFIYNLRVSGPVFYSDESEKEEKPSASVKIRRR